MGGEAEHFLKIERTRAARQVLPAEHLSQCDQLQAILRDLWLTVGITNITDQALGTLVVAGLMVERAKALGVDHESVEQCADEVRLAVVELLDA